MRLIDADALKQYATGGVTSVGILSLAEIDKAPTIDAVEVVHGRWESDAPDKHGYKKPRCSVCGEFHLFMWSDYASCKYCPNCGAKMDMKGE